MTFLKFYLSSRLLISLFDQNCMNKKITCQTKTAQMLIQGILLLWLFMLFVKTWGFYVSWWLSLSDCTPFARWTMGKDLKVLSIQYRILSLGASDPVFILYRYKPRYFYFQLCKSALAFEGGLWLYLLGWRRWSNRFYRSNNAASGASMVAKKIAALYFSTYLIFDVFGSHYYLKNDFDNQITFTLV